MVSMIRHTDGAEILDTGSYDGWSFRHTEGARGEVRSLGGESVEGGFTRLSQGHPVWSTEAVCSKSGMRLRETRKGRVEEIRECRAEEYVALVDFGEQLQRVDAREILVSHATGGSWSICEAPEGMGFHQQSREEWVDISEESELPEPESTSELTFEKIGGRGAQNEVNSFLEGYEDGAVDHKCGGVHHWKAGFVARYEGHIIGVIVLAPHQNGQIAAEGEEVVISRIACHPSRPHNTSTWLISRARKWAERSGYSRVSALAGVDGNEGSCYKGAGFELEEREEDYVDGNGNKWVKHRYVYELEPEKYDGRDVPMPGEEQAADPASA